MFSTIIENFTFTQFIDIIIIFSLFYYIYKFIARTPVLPVLQGFIVILVITALSAIFELNTLNYILEKVVSLMLLAAIILFPAEIKKGLYRIGGKEFFQSFSATEDKFIKEIILAVAEFKRNKTGALIIFKLNDSLQSVIDSGTILSTIITRNMLVSIFDKNNFLHDGAVIISGNKIEAAACYVRSLAELNNDKLGTRHRAAVGLSEQTDALIVVVSEETGSISVVQDGGLKYGVSLPKLEKLLKANLSDQEDENGKFFKTILVDKSRNKASKPLKKLTSKSKKSLEQKKVRRKNLQELPKKKIIEKNNNLKKKNKVKRLKKNN